MRESGRTSQRDGGYGWVVVVAFFFVEILIDGIRFSFGNLFVEFLQAFKRGRGETAWIGSIMISFYNLGGPVFSLLVLKLGARNAAFLGAITASLSYVLSSFATEPFHLYFTYGLLQGLGFGVVFLAGNVLIGRYFYTKRARAFGIGLCGSGIGTFIFPPLLQLCLEEYTWTGTMFIMAGVALNCCVFSAFFRPYNGPIEEESAELQTTIHADEENVPTPIFKPKYNKPLPDTLKVSSQNGIHLTENHSPLLSTSPVSDEKRPSDNQPPLKQRTFADMRNSQLESYRQKFTASQRSLNVSVLSHSVLGSNASFDYIFRKRTKSDVSRRQNNDVIIDDHISDPNGDVFSIDLVERLFPKRLVTDLNFNILMISSFLYGISTFIPFSILPDYSLAVGCKPNESAWLVSIIGIGGLIGRVVGGWLADMSCVRGVLLLGAVFFLCSVITLVVPLLVTFELLAVYSFLYGLFMGSTYVIQPIAIFDMFPEEYISEIFGILMFGYGISSLIGSPTAGWLFDITGSYTVSFLFGGGMFFISSVLNTTVICTKQSREMHQKKRQMNEI